MLSEQMFVKVLSLIFQIFHEHFLPLKSSTAAKFTLSIFKMILMSDIFCVIQIKLTLIIIASIKEQ